MVSPHTYDMLFLQKSHTCCRGSGGSSQRSLHSASRRVIFQPLCHLLIQGGYTEENSGMYFESTAKRTELLKTDTSVPRHPKTKLSSCPQSHTLSFLQPFCINFPQRAIVRSGNWKVHPRPPTANSVCSVVRQTWNRRLFNKSRLKKRCPRSSRTLAANNKQLCEQAGP